MIEGLEEVGQFGYGFLKIFLSEISEKAKKFFTINKIGFIPEGIDYSELQKVKNKTVFKQLKFLIGKHQTLSIIMVGISVSSLNRNVKAKILEDHKNKIYSKHGKAGISILNLATTGFIEGYIKWLSDYNIKNNPSQSELIDIYEKNLVDWGERSIFIQSNPNNETPTETALEKITTKINMGKDVFFVFASKSAIKIMDKVITENKEFFKNEKYDFISNKLNNNDDERVWIFEKITINQNREKD